MDIARRIASRFRDSQLALKVAAKFKAACEDEDDDEVVTVIEDMSVDMGDGGMNFKVKEIVGLDPDLSSRRWEMEVRLSHMGSAQVAKFPLPGVNTVEMLHGCLGRVLNRMRTPRTKYEGEFSARDQRPTLHVQDGAKVPEKELQEYRTEMMGDSMKVALP